MSTTVPPTTTPTTDPLAAAQQAANDSIAAMAKLQEISAQLNNAQQAFTAVTSAQTKQSEAVTKTFNGAHIQ